MITVDELPFQRFEPLPEITERPAQRGPAHPLPEATLNAMDAWFHAWAIGPSIMLAMLQQLHTDTRRHSRRLPR